MWLFGSDNLGGFRRRGVDLERLDVQSGKRFGISFTGRGG